MARHVTAVAAPAAARRAHRAVACLDRGIGGAFDRDDLQCVNARRALSLLCLAVCATTLVGCGSSDTFSFDPVASAAGKMVKSTSSRVEFTATMEIDGVGGMSFSGSGVFDGRARSGALNMRF